MPISSEFRFDILLIYFVRYFDISTSFFGKKLSTYVYIAAVGNEIEVIKGQK